MTAARIPYPASQINLLFPAYPLHERNEELLVSSVFEEELCQQSLTHQ